MSPIITIPRHEDRATRFIGVYFANNHAASCVIAFLILLVATVPTVGDAIESLTDFCAELLETLKQMTVINAELEARDLLQVENIHHVGHTIPPPRLNHHTHPTSGATTDCHLTGHRYLG